MNKISPWKIIVSILLTIVAIIYALPNFTDNKSYWLPDNQVNLGLDLRGGSHLLLSVDFDSYIEELSQSISATLKKSLRDKKIGYKNFIIKKNNLKFECRNQHDISSIKKIIRETDGGLSYSIDGDSFTIYYSEYELTRLQDKLIDQSIEIVRMRVDSTGTKEPNIQRQGVKDILLQVPGENNPNELKRVLGKTAKLTFHLVDEGVSLERAKAGSVPIDSRIAKSEDGTGIVVIKKKIIIGGEHLNDAQAQFNDAMPAVKFVLNSIGAKKFAEVTTKNTGKKLAIVLDDKVLSAPVINTPILGGDGVITGNFTVESATDLALMLRAGALPAPLKIVEERSIGPNLGADSIKSGKTAAIVGFVLVTIFMLLTYGILGIFANITLVIALLYIFALLSMLQATLTLPGIAGIILTIGMAVDANVLIYERIREELTKGCSNLYAVKIGFESAFATILDSNITTLIAAFLLYNFGVGAIKGFAVTLTIGIISSMYTALIITKLMIDLWLKYAKPKSLGL
jgi:preprotein translocase subunit SecD